MAVIEVDSGDREVALRFCRLFLNTDDLAAFDLGHTESLRVLHLCERQKAVGAAAVELIDEPPDSAHHHVVAEIENEFVIPDKRLRNFYGVRKPQGGLLRNVRDL